MENKSFTFQVYSFTSLRETNYISFGNDAVTSYKAPTK